MPHHTLHLLGTPSLLGPDGTTEALPQGKPLALLCFIALEPKGVTRADAASMLWPASSGKRASASVRQALWTIKKGAGAELVTEGADGTLTLDRTAAATDLDELATAIQSKDADRVAAMWAGGPLQGFVIPGAAAWNQWASELHATWERRVGEFLEAHAASSPPAERARWTREAVAVRPHRGAAHSAHVRALLELGQFGEAREALARARAECSDGGGGEEEFTLLDSKIRESERADYLADRDGTLATPLVGRTREFSALSEALERALAGRSQRITVLGPPGIGKTRLVQEFIPVAEVNGAYVVSATAAVAERSISFGVVGALSRGLLALPGAAGISDASMAVLKSVVPSRASGSTPLVGRPNPAAMGDAFADLLDAIAEENPLLVVVDDLQWVDSDSRALLQRAMRLVPRRPLLLIATCRSEEGDRDVLRGVIADKERGHTEVLRLGPLEPGDIRELISDSVSFAEVPDLNRLAVLVHQASQGHPLHAVSVLQDLRDRGIIVQDGEGWTFDGAAFSGEITMPGGLRALLNQRLERLPDPARALLGGLAGEAQAMRPSALAGPAGLSEAELSASLNEVLDSELVRWVDDERIDFAHGLLREAAERRRGTRRPRGWRWAVAAVAVIAVLVTAALAGREPETSLWSQSTLQLRYPDRVVQLAPRPGGDWAVVDSVLGRAAERDTAFWPWAQIDLEGSVVVGALRVPDRGPDVAILGEDGELRTLLDGGGDDGFLDYGNTSRPILVSVEDVSSPEYRLDLEAYDPVSGERTVLLEPEFRAMASWSPDLRRIDVLNLTLEGPDQLLRLRPDGSVVHDVVLPPGQASSLESCGPQSALVSLQAPLEVLRWFRVEWLSGRMERLPAPVSQARRLGCSPDGEHYVAVFEDGSEVVVYERSSLSVASRIPLPWGPRPSFSWRSDSPAVPVAVRARAPDSLAWGDLGALGGRVLDQYGRDLKGIQVTWRSIDPLVAGIRGDSVIGNGPGVASLVARADGWLEDTVAVRVVGESTPGLLLAETFGTDWREAWTVIGQPEPRLETFEDGGALDVGGDSNWIDGIRSQASVPADRGLTAEVQFRLPLTDRRDRQSITVCLVRDDVEITSIGSVMTPDSGACVTYPQGELNQFSAAHARLTPLSRAAVPGYPADGLGGDEWGSIGLQLRSDGRLSAIVNGEEVGEFPELVPLPPDSRVNLVITGRATDTQLLVRSVTVWEGPRY